MSVPPPNPSRPLTTESTTSPMAMPITLTYSAAYHTVR